MTDREREIDELYEHLAGNWRPQSGLVPLGECDPPAEAGVYVFFEPGEVRRNGEPRIASWAILAPPSGESDPQLGIP